MADVGRYEKRVIFWKAVLQVFFYDTKEKRQFVWRKVMLAEYFIFLLLLFGNVQGRYTKKLFKLLSLETHFVNFLAGIYLLLVLTWNLLAFISSKHTTVAPKVQALIRKF